MTYDLYTGKYGIKISKMSELRILYCTIAYIYIKLLCFSPIKCTFPTTYGIYVVLAAHLATSTVSAASVLHDEGTLWLSLVYKSLAGRVSVRYPYQAELTRNIPFAIFKEITLLLRRSTSPEFQEPHCIIGKNKKGEVISFTCLGSLLKLFQLLTGMSSRKVRNYFTRVLNGSSRGGHRVKLIVSHNKDFAFVYKYKTGQLSIQFKYGEWNTFGHPQHPCQMNDQER